MLSKGNENLSLQALYLVTRIKTLQQTFADAVNNQDTKAYGQIVSALWNFCGDTDPASATQDEARACLKRYVQAKSLDLQSMKAAIVQNRTAELSYRSKANQSFQVSSEDKPTPKIAQYARAPTQEELTKQARAQEEEMRRLGSNAYAEWAAALPKEPNHADYCKTTQTSDPDDPKGKIEVAVLDSNGNCAAFDEGKYKLDGIEYNSLKAELKASNTKPHSIGEVIAPHATAETLSENAYKTSHNEFTSKSNQTLATGVRTISFGEAQRNTAAADQYDAKGYVVERKPPPSLQRDQHTTRYLPEDIEIFLKKIDPGSKDGLEKFLEDGIQR